MLRGSNPIKVQEWTERLLRSQNSAVTATQFCDAEGVSLASFYQWKRKLGDQLSKSPSKKASRVDQVKKTGRRKVIQTNERSAFETVQLVSSAKMSHPALAVCLSGGIQVQVADNLPAIQAVMRELMNVEKNRRHAEHRQPR